jgi:hypothetical protein
MEVPMTPEQEYAVDMKRCEALAQEANKAFAGQPVDDVAVALAILTAMLIAGSVDETDTEQRVAQVLLHAGQHFRLAVELVPSFMDTINNGSKH